MYQGVFIQCRGVAHNSTFSDFPQSAELFLFTFQYFVPMGHFTIPIVTLYGESTIPYIYNPFAALYEAFTIPYIFNGAFILPILGCFHCTLHLPSLWGVSIHMGHLSIPFKNFPDSWGTYPSHSHFCSSILSHFWQTWSLSLFLLTALKLSQVHFIAFEISASFLFIFTDSCLSQHIFTE